jgi:hypothetical protein
MWRTSRLVSCALLVSVAVLVETWSAWPQRKGGAGLTVVVQPEATMTVEVVDLPDSDSSGQTTRWFEVDIAVRVKSGSTASLFLEHIASSSGLQNGGVPNLTYFVRLPGNAPPKPWDIANSPALFTTQRNGRFSLFIGIGIDSLVRQGQISTESIQFVLKSSDGLFSVTKTVPLNAEIGGTTTSEKQSG